MVIKHEQIKFKEHTVLKARRSARKKHRHVGSFSDGTDVDYSTFEPKIPQKKCKKRVCQRERMVYVDETSSTEEVSEDSMDLMEDLLNETDESDEEGRKKRKKYKPHNGFGGKLVKNKCYYRSNMQTALTEIHDLDFSKGHMELPRKTPFWLFLLAMKKAKIDSLVDWYKKNEECIRSIMETFDAPIKCFMIGDEELELTRRDVQLIYGVFAGSKEIPLKAGDTKKPTWLNRCFKKEIARGGIFKITKADLLKKIKERIKSKSETEVRDVCRLTHCYLIACVFAPKTNTGMSWHLADFAEDIDNMCLYDWSSYIVNVLVEQMGKSQSMTSGGCAMLLPYWLCEHTIVVKAADSQAFPRFLRWDLRDLYRALRNSKPKHLKCRQVKNVMLKPLPHEKHHFSVLLKRRRELKLSIKKGKRKVTVGEETDSSSDDSMNEKYGKHEHNNVSASQYNEINSESGSEDSERGFRLEPQEETVESPLRHSSRYISRFEGKKVVRNNNKKSTHSKREVREADEEAKGNETPVRVCDVTGYDAHNLGDEYESVKEVPTSNTHDDVWDSNKVDTGVSQDKTVSSPLSDAGGICIVDKLLECDGSAAGRQETEKEDFTLDDGSNTNVGNQTPKDESFPGSGFVATAEEQVVGEGVCIRTDPKKPAVDLTGQDETIASVDRVGVTFHNPPSFSLGMDLTQDDVSDVVGLRRRVQELTSDIEVKDVLLSTLRSEILEKDCEMQRVVHDMNEELVECKRVNNELKTRVLELEARILEVTGLCEELKGEKRSALSRADAVGKRKLCEIRQLEAALLEKDEVIKNLVAEKESLTARLEELANPTTTQMLERPEVQENFKYVELLFNAKEEIKHLEAKTADDEILIAQQQALMENMQLVPFVGQAQTYPVLPEETTIDAPECSRKRQRVRRHVTPGSIARGIKQRTDGNGRKRKKTTPGCISREVIDMTGDDDDDNGQEPDIIQREAFPGLNPKYHAVKLSKTHILDTIEELWGENGKRFEVYSGKNSYGMVILQSCIDILEHKRISSFVIDAWVEILQTYLRPKYPMVEAAMVFPACLWGEIKKVQKSGVVSKWVDNNMENALSHDVLLFPINPSIDDDPESLCGDHWVLLKYNVKRDEWQYFNSLPPRTASTKDVYLKPSLRLITYVETHMRKVLSRTKPRHSMLRKQPQKPECSVMVPCKQAAGSLDCGVVVLYLIEFFMKKQGGKWKSEYTEILAGAHRKRIVEWILDPLSIVV